MKVRVIYHFARADFLERVRRYSFLITLLFAVYLGYAAATGKVALRLGKYRGVYTSAWIGTNMALVAACFISLVGFYIVKNAIERDRFTRVGEILAATPLTRFTYLVGKWLSNTTVLAVQVGILALASIVMQFVVSEDPHLDLWALLAPFLLLALPAIALTGALALLFETLPVLRGGIGNVIWVFAWVMGIGFPALTDLKWLDFSGLFTVMTSITHAASAAIPGYNGEFELQITLGQPTIVANGLRWQGLRWDLPEVFLRLAWIGVAFALVLLATLFFDRFDPARGRRLPRARPLSRQESNEAAATVMEPPSASAAPSRGHPLRHLTPLNGARSWGLHRMFVAELRLALKGYPWWWYALAGGLVVGQCAAPVEISRGPLLTAAWIWPILLWSAMGTREARYGTEQLIFSGPRVVSRQGLAGWMAGVVVAAAIGGGVAVRLLLAPNYSGLFGWLAGALFIPTLALALGVWTKSSRPFEGIFTGLWYTGPLNRVPGFDFTGGANGPHTAEYACIYFALTAALLTAALFGRKRQIRS